MGEERWRSAVLYHDQLQGEAFRGSLPVPLRTQGRESGHLPPTLLLGQLSTGSCFWRRFSPAKKPAAWLPNPPDRPGTATKLQGTNLMVALGGAGWGECVQQGGSRRMHFSPSPCTHQPSQPLPPQWYSHFTLETHSIFSATPVSTYPPAPALVLLFSVSISL